MLVFVLALSSLEILPYVYQLVKHYHSATVAIKRNFISGTTSVAVTFFVK